MRPSELEAIANLEFGRAVAEISERAQEKKRTLSALPRGGPLESGKLQLQIEQSEETCRTFARIWENLLEQNNGGYLTRENVTFIMEKVTHIVAVRRTHLLSSPDHPRLGSAGGTIARHMDKVRASINQDLEIKFRKQALPPKKEDMGEKLPINVTIHNAANVNLGTQYGTVHAALTAISQHGDSQREIATALQELTDAVMKNNEIQEAQKHETLDVIQEITKQADTKPESRSLGTVKVMISGLNTLINASPHLVAAWEKCSPVVKHYFKIP